MTHHKYACKKWGTALPAKILSSQEMNKSKWKVSANGCWKWNGYVGPNGYARYGTLINGRRLMAHRVVYEALVGPIPEGLTLDHLCKNPSCVNPEHLEPVTMRENIMRGNGLASKNSKKTHCRRHHKFTASNTYRYAGRRFCKQCRREYNRGRA